MGFLLRSPSFPESLPRAEVATRNRAVSLSQVCLSPPAAGIFRSCQGGAAGSHCALPEADLQLKFIFSTVADSWSGCGSLKVGELLQSDRGKHPMSSEHHLSVSPQSRAKSAGAGSRPPWCTRGSPLLNPNHFPHCPQTRFPSGFQASPKPRTYRVGAQTRDSAESAMSRRRSVWGYGRRPRGCFPHNLTALAGRAGLEGGRGGAAPPGGGHVGGGAARGGAGWGLQGSPAHRVWRLCRGGEMKRSGTFRDSLETC